MQQSLSTLKTALRVLTAINDGHQPDPADVASLHSYAGPPPTGIELDEFACEVIHKTVKRFPYGTGNPKSSLESTASDGGNKALGD